jgi:methylase of polypeptide subunit release factors
VFLEIAYDQGALAREVAGRYQDLEDVRIIKDHAAHDRVLTARRK